MGSFSHECLPTRTEMLIEGMLPSLRRNQLLLAGSAALTESIEKEVGSFASWEKTSGRASERPRID